MSISNVTMTTFDAYLKEYYVDKKNLHNVAMFNKVALGLIPKDPSAAGDTWVQPLAVANQVGDAATYASASANASSGLDVKFYGTWKDRWAMTFIQDKVLKLSTDPRGAFKRAAQKIDQLMDQFKQSVALQVFRAEGGALARLATMTASLPNGGPLTLSAADKEMAQFIHKDMKLAFGTAATIDEDGVNRTVASVDKQAGTFTVSAGGVGEVASQAYLFKDGDPGLALCGFSSWVPDDAPTDTFKNVDRSQDSVGLGGLRLAASGLTVEESIIQAVNDTVQYGGQPDAVFIHPKKHAMLIKEMSGRISWVRTQGQSFTGKGRTDAFGFKGLEVAAGGIVVPVYADAHCQLERGWVSQLDTWKLYSAGEVPHVRDLDGLKMLRQANENYITEILAYMEQLCSAPQRTCVIKFDQTT